MGKVHTITALNVIFCVIFVRFYLVFKTNIDGYISLEKTLKCSYFKSLVTMIIHVKDMMVCSNMIF